LAKKEMVTGMNYPTNNNFEKECEDAQSEKCTEIHFQNKANIEQLNHLR
jgi:hypothetical protein